MTDADQPVRVGTTTEGPADGGVEAGQSVDLPVEEILTGRAFATGKSGSGKSNSGGVIAEQLLDRGHPLFIIDIEGEYYSLKEKYEVLHAGADEDCDIRVGPEHAEKLASLALEQYVPIVLDLSGFLDEDRRDELVYEVAKQLFAKEKQVRRPFLLIVEEIHEFAPEGSGLGEVGEMLIRVAKRGRKRGLGIMGMSQRPANVKKDFITQCDWLVWHRLTWNNDTKVVKRMLGSEYADAVEDLADGEAFVQTDWDEQVRRVQWRRKDTFDAGATPGLDDVGRPELKSISDDLAEELDEITAEAERRRDELARKDQRIEELEDELEQTRDELQRAREVSEMADQMSERITDAMAAAAGDDEAGAQAVETIKADVMEIREEKRDLEEQLAEVRAERDEFRDRVEELEDELAEREAAADLRALRDDVVDLVQRHEDILDVEASNRLDDLKQEVQSLREERDRLKQAQAPEGLETDPLENRKVQRLVEEMTRRLESLGAKEQKMLRYLMIEGPAGMKEAYKYAGGSPSSGAKSQKMQTLREAGLAMKKGRGEYDYALQNHVEDKLGDDFSSDEIDRVVAEVEDLVDQTVMAEGGDAR